VDPPHTGTTQPLCTESAEVHCDKD
jgi:hypothetical protein